MTMSGPSEFDFGRIFDRTLEDADLEAIRDQFQRENTLDVAEQVADLLHQYSALLEVARRFSSELSLDVLLPQLIEVVTGALRAEVATLFLYDFDTEELYSRVAQGGEINEIRISADAGIVGAVFQSGKALSIPDAYADSRFNPAIDRETGLKTRDIVCVPLRNRAGEVIGAAQVLNKRDGTFTEADIALLSTITTHAASALEHAQMFERTEKARQEDARMTEIMGAISTEISLEALLAKIMNGATQLLNAERSTLFLYDDKTEELWSLVAEGAGSREIRVPAGAGIAGAVVKSGELLNIPDAYADARFNPEVDRGSGFKTRSILCVPIINARGELIGVTQVLNKIEGIFTADDERRMRAFAAQASAALENAELFDEVLRLKNYNEGILKSLSNGVVTLDSDKIITKVNDATARILQREEQELVGKPAEVVFGNSNPWITKSIEYVAQSGSDDFHADVDLLQPDGDAVSVNLTTSPLRSVDDEAIGYTLVLDDISREKRVRSTMARYMAKEVVDKVLEAGEGALEATTHEATVLFSDIRGFTTISETLGTHRTIAMLNEYFEEMVEVIFTNGGILDKYIGDAIMAVFGAPITNPYDAENAVRVATEMMEALQQFNIRQISDGWEPIQVRIGMCTGEVVAGTIGSTKRMEYTVMGDTVNMAARLESANKYYRTEVLMSASTVEQISSREGLREIDMVRVKGILQPVIMYESLRHHPDETKAQLAALLPHYREGMAAYRQQQWDDAISLFEKALEARPDDGASGFFINRCRFFRENPPPADWDGVWTDRRT